MLCSPTKTERPRDVKVPASALAALRAHRKRQDEFRKKFGPAYRADLDLIFANPDGTALRPNSVSSVVSLLFRRLNLPKGASLHSLRHSHGSHLLADGVPLPVVSERLGHSRCGRRRRSTRMRSEAKTTRRPCAGTNFNAAEPGIA